MTDVTATERAAAGPPATGPAGTAAVLTVDNLRVSFGPDEVVKGISFTTYRGRCLAIVGESGSGKSVTARTLVGLTGAGSAVQADRIDLGGVDLTRQSERAWRSIRGREISFILQDALVSLDQLRLVGDEVSEPLKLHGRGTKTSRRERAIELLGSVGVPEPEMRVRQRPYELSGGLQQRALIASAIALDPGLLIADEPTTALDVTIQAQVHDLLADSKARGRSIILISHDLSVVARLADEVNRTVVDDVSFELFKGETLGIVGESGSGKTTTARIALAVLPGTAGYVLLHGHPWSALSSAARRPLRKRIGVIYQDPLSSFDPRWAAGRVIIDALGTGSRPPSSRAEGRAR
ncbi:MAG TPA: ATP-binding cassette domain-containing protein, partial [Streptosporangiaceae bacterium]